MYSNQHIDRSELYILHGWSYSPDNEAKWQPFIELLQRKSLTVYWVPLPGLDNEIVEPWTIEKYIEYVLHYLPADKPVILLGHSFGGQLATLIAAQNPERVSALILVDSAGVRDHSTKARFKRTIFGLAAKIGKTITHSPAARKILYKLAREKDYYAATPVLRATMAHVIAVETISKLSDISAKTLVVWGSKDTITPIWMGELLAKGIQKATLVVVQDARHAPQFSHPQEVADLVISFLTKNTDV